ncbi:bacterioferritin (plasmid) [Chloroflexota bacterium]|nr:bacterioferritin [Chloroflexota bacterium]
MKGHQEVIDILNKALAEELTSINQYMLHSEMCDDWGYGKLHGVIEARAITEMKHAEKLIGRILFLEGMPILSELEPLHIGSTVQKQLENDHAAELEAVKLYNEAIALTTKLADNGTKVLVESILTEEEDHIDWIEEQLDQIEQMSIQVWLNHQI